MAFVYNVNDWKQCLAAYFFKLEGDEVEPVEKDIEITNDSPVQLNSNDMIDHLKQTFEDESGKITSEAASIILHGSNDLPTYLSLVEAIKLTEFDPMTEGGEAFWKNLFECKSLKEEAEKEGAAFGKWDVLRQAINMGSIAYIAKLNTAMSFVHKYGRNDLVLTVIHKMFGIEYRMLVARESAKNE